MEKSNSLNQHSSKLLDDSYFNEFLYVLDAMCYGDYTNKDSKEHRKAILCFNLFKERKWKVDEFNWVIKEFILCHRSNNWYPADFLDHYEENYGRF